MQDFDYLIEKFESLSIDINYHYLNRYIRFILSLKEISVGYGESHHILPKGKSMFPEYIDANPHKWNQKRIDARAHYLCHWMLMKALPGDYGQCMAFDSMCNGSNSIHGRRYKINARAFAFAKTKKSEAMSIYQIGRVGPGKGKYGKESLAYGAKWSDDAKLRQSESKMGKSLYDLHGVDEANRIKALMSDRQSGDNNAAFGVVYCYDLQDETLSSVTKLTKSEYASQLSNIRYVLKNRSSVAKMKDRRGIIDIKNPESGFVAATLDAETLIVSYRAEQAYGQR